MVLLEISRGDPRRSNVRRWNNNAGSSIERISRNTSCTFGANYILIFCIEELISFDEIPIGLYNKITWRPYIEFQYANELVNGLAQCFLAKDGIAIESTWSPVPCQTSRPRRNRWSMRACSIVDPGGSRTPPSPHEPRLTNEAMIGL